MKSEKEIKKRIEFIESVLLHGDEFLDITLTPTKRRRYNYELRLLRWVLNLEEMEK